MGYCVNKRTAQKEDKTVFIQKKINNKLSLIVIQEFQNSRITSPFELLDLPCMWHTLTCAYTPIKCSAPLPVARVTKPAHLQLPKSNKKLFFFSSCSLCCSQALISLFACLTLLFLCSSPFSPIRTRKEVDRNKAAYSQKSPKEVLPPSRSFSNRGAVTSKATLLKWGDKNSPIWLLPSILGLFCE